MISITKIQSIFKHMFVIIIVNFEHKIYGRLRIKSFILHHLVRIFEMCSGHPCISIISAIEKIVDIREVL